MKLSTVRVSQIFNTGAIHETDPEGEIERLLGEYFDELAAKHCAAGPWRFDVENAPKDGSEFLIWYDDQDAGWRLRIIHWYEPFKNFRDRMDYGVYMPCMAAFTIPNPPQVIQRTQSFEIPEWHDNDSGGYVQ